MVSVCDRCGALPREPATSGRFGPEPRRMARRAMFVSVGLDERRHPAREGEPDVKLKVMQAF